MDVRSAELTKYAANAMLAARISFMNEVANLADRLGADVDHVRRGIGADSRIGPSFLYAGCGYGGSCFPKDTRALISTAAEQGLPMQVVAATEAVNEGQKRLLVQRTQAFLGQDLTGRVIAVWGLAFKPNTDDMREASSRVIVAELLRLGARVQAYDPVAGHEALAALREDLMDAPGALARLQLVEHDVQALDGADALLVVTEWKHFHNPDFEALRQRMRQPLIIDGRNLYEPALLQDLGIAYHGIGRRNALAQAALAARAQA
jgi:UDPglucose 6-dehydrogenase